MSVRIERTIDPRCVGYIFNDRTRISCELISASGHKDRAAAAGDLFNHSDRGQDRTGILTAQMNGRAVLALPHSGIAGDAADRAADGRFTAIYINCAAVDITNHSAVFHLKNCALHPNCTCGADGACIAFASCDRRSILNHAAGFHDQFGLICHPYSRHTAEVPQHRALTQCDRAGDGCVGGDDGVLHINEIIVAGGTDRTIADSLSKHRALFLAGIVKNDVRQSQTSTLTASGLHLDHGGVVPFAGRVILCGKAMAACDGVRPSLAAGDRQRLAVKTGALLHSQVAHDIDRRAVLRCVDRLGQRGVGSSLRTDIAIVAAAADIDRRAPIGIGRCRKECETQHKCQEDR